MSLNNKAGLNYSLKNCQKLLDDIQLEHTKSYIIAQLSDDDAGYCMKAGLLRDTKAKKTVEIRFESREKCFSSIYHGMYLNGKSPLGELAEERIKVVFQDQPEQKKYLKSCRSKLPRVGMSKQLLMVCLGKPTKEMKFEGQDGQQILYFWGNGRSARLKNSIVTEVL